MHTSVPLVASLLLVLAACDGEPNPKDAEAFCADLATQNEGCWNDGLTDACVDVYVQCETEIVILESCPVQLDCAS